MILRRNLFRLKSIVFDRVSSMLNGGMVQYNDKARWDSGCSHNLRFERDTTSAVFFALHAAAQSVVASLCCSLNGAMCEICSKCDITTDAAILGKLT